MSITAWKSTKHVIVYAHPQVPADCLLQQTSDRNRWPVLLAKEVRAVNAVVIFLLRNSHPEVPRYAEDADTIPGLDQC